MTLSVRNIEKLEPAATPRRYYDEGKESVKGLHMVVTPTNIAFAISQNEARTERALDQLINKGLAIYGLNYLHGTSYRLSGPGRDLAIDSGII